MNKKNLRKYYSDKRSSITKYQHNLLSKKALDQLINWPPYQEANRIMTFVSFKEEIDTHRIIEHSIETKKDVYVPITIKKDKKLLISQIHSLSQLETGPYNILTPKKEYIRLGDKNKLDLIIVPGLSFDKSGHRLGFGGGYYDKFLSNLDPNIIKLGLAFHIQISKNDLPKEEHDLPVDYILTDQAIIKCDI